MKISEFAIGNWVCYKGKPIKIRWVSKNGLSLEVEDKIYICEKDEINNDVEPIPLTKEILEKNEFYYGYTAQEEDCASQTGAALDEKGWVSDDGAEVIKIIFPQNDDGGEVVCLYDGKFINLMYEEDIYVHQLQNLLTLVGIDKKIIL